MSTYLVVWNYHLVLDKRGQHWEAGGTRVAVALVRVATLLLSIRMPGTGSFGFWTWTRKALRRQGQAKGRFSARLGREVWQAAGKPRQAAGNLRWGAGIWQQPARICRQVASLPTQRPRQDARLRYSVLYSISFASSLFWFLGRQAGNLPACPRQPSCLPCRARLRSLAGCRRSESSCRAAVGLACLACLLGRRPAEG